MLGVLRRSVFLFVSIKSPRHLAAGDLDVEPSLSDVLIMDKDTGQLVLPEGEYDTSTESVA